MAGVVAVDVAVVAVLLVVDPGEERVCHFFEGLAGGSVSEVA